MKLHVGSARSYKRRICLKAVFVCLLVSAFKNCDGVDLVAQHSVAQHFEASGHVARRSALGGNLLQNCLLISLAIRPSIFPVSLSSQVSRHTP